MPCDYKDYHPSFKRIALEVKTEAGWRCVECNRPCRKPGEELKAFWMRLYDDAYMQDRSADELNDMLNHPQRFTLTTAHIDPDPQNCEKENLLALCSVCHLRRDARMHAVNAQETRRHKQEQDRQARGQLALEGTG